MANDKKKMVEAITAQEVDFAQWYTDICTCSYGRTCNRDEQEL